MSAFPEAKLEMFYGWRMVGTCFVIAAFAWTLGLFGSSVYLQAVTTTHGWSVAQVSSAITLFFWSARPSSVRSEEVSRSMARAPSS